MLIIEAAHTFGLCLFVYKVLPAYDIIRALLLTCSTSIVPAALKLLLTKGGRSALSVIVDICALLMQCSVFFLVTMFTRTREFQLPDSLHLLELCASVVLISLRYWENFIDRDIGTLAVQNFKQTLRLGRCKMYIFASIWKIALTLAFAYLLIPQVRVIAPLWTLVPHLEEKAIIIYLFICFSRSILQASVKRLWLHFYQLSNINVLTYKMAYDHLLATVRNVRYFKSLVILMFDLLSK